MGYLKRGIHERPHSGPNELKFRVAIGKAGNNRIKADMWRYIYSTNSSGGPNFGESTLNPDGEIYYDTSNYLPNPDIKWETTLTRNFAFDIALFNNRLRITPRILLEHHFRPYL